MFNTGIEVYTPKMYKCINQTSKLFTDQIQITIGQLQVNIFIMLHCTK